MVAARSRVSARNTARLISATWRSKVRIVPMHPSTLVSWRGGVGGFNLYGFSPISMNFNQWTPVNMTFISFFSISLSLYLSIFRFYHLSLRVLNRIHKGVLTDLTVCL